MIQVQYVPPQFTPRVWPHVAPLLAKAVPYARGEYTIEHAQHFVNSGQWRLLVAVEDPDIVGACTVSVYNGPVHRMALITLCGGKALLRPEVFAQVCDYLQADGVTRVQAYMRPAMVRLAARVGLAPAATLVECPL